MMADVRENNSKLVLELQAGSGGNRSHSTLTLKKDHSTGPNQILRMHKIGDAVQDLCGQPKLFATMSGDDVPADVLESMKNPHATPGAWRTKPPSKPSCLRKLLPVPAAVANGFRESDATNGKVQEVCGSAGRGSPEKATGASFGKASLEAPSSGALEEGERSGGQQVEERLVGSRIRKLFPKYGYFNGVITSFDAEKRLYLVNYDDGDQDQLTFKELAPYLKKEMTVTGIEAEGQVATAGGNTAAADTRGSKIAAQRLSFLDEGAQERGADREEWNGPDGIRPHASPCRMTNGIQNQILVLSSCISGYGPRQGGVIKAGSVLRMELEHKEIKEGRASLVLVTKVFSDEYGGEDGCPSNYVLPIEGVELWGKIDIASLENTDDVPHAKELSLSMLAGEVLQTVYCTEGRPLNVNNLLSIGKIVYDDELCSTRGRFSDPTRFWKGFEEQHFYFCTGVCMLHKLPCEWRDSRAKNAAPARARLELCVSTLDFAPTDDTGLIQRHARDHLIPSQYQEKKGCDMIGSLREPVAQVAGGDGDLNESVSSATGSNAQETQFPDQTIRKNAIGRWMAFSLIERCIYNPVEQFQLFSECERFYHGVFEWMHNKATRKWVSEGSPESDYYTTKTFGDISISAIFYKLYSTDALRFAEISFESQTRQELKPASVQGGIRLTAKKALERAKPQSSLFQVRILVRNLDEESLQKALRLPTLKNPFHHTQTGAEFHIGCTDPSSPCPGRCCCTVTIREIMQKGEKHLQLEATNYRQGLRGDRHANSMDMQGSEAVPQGLGSFPLLPFPASHHSAFPPPAGTLTSDKEEDEKCRLESLEFKRKQKVQMARMEAKRRMLKDFDSEMREIDAWYARAKANGDGGPRFQNALVQATDPAQIHGSALPVPGGPFPIPSAQGAAEGSGSCAMQTGS